MRCSYGSRRRGLESNPLHAHPLTLPSPPQALLRALGTPKGSLAHSLKMIILSQPPPFATGENEAQRSYVTWLRLHSQSAAWAAIFLQLFFHDDT